MIEFFSSRYFTDNYKSEEIETFRDITLSAITSLPSYQRERALMFQTDVMVARLYNELHQEKGKIKPINLRKYDAEEYITFSKVCDAYDNRNAEVLLLLESLRRGGRRERFHSFCKDILACKIREGELGASRVSAIHFDVRQVYGKQLESKAEESKGNKKRRCVIS